MIVNALKIKYKKEPGRDNTMHGAEDNLKTKL